jgi:Raf kinase inhibitor-like YbhB/YbcL family protein
MSHASAIAAALCIATASLLAQVSPSPSSAGTLATQQVAGEGSAATIVVTSSSALAHGPLPLAYSDYGERISPALQWTGVPAEARSIALVVEDQDAQEPKPFVHWMLYNLPATITSLPEALPGLPRLPELADALQGRNSKGTIGYFGPRPPRTDSAHHYHFQIFAVTEMLPMLPSASREALLAALTGRVVATGGLVVTFQAPLYAR